MLELLFLLFYKAKFVKVILGKNFKFADSETDFSRINKLETLYWKSANFAVPRNTDIESI